MKTTVISLGGSLIVPSHIDLPFLKKFKRFALNYIKKNNRLILVCGGGKTCRYYQNAATKLNKTISTDLDWIGIMATRLNAELVRVMFKQYAYKEVIYNPYQKIKTSKKIIIAAGFEPGCSTDTDTVILAKHFKADLIINTTNTDYVYDKDPNKYKNAQKFENLSWSEYKRLISSKFESGMHAPFDPVASRLAQKYKMKVAIINGKKLGNLRKILDHKKFIGTIIE
jgi:uridylate kinase